jgi:prolipoprotein diacylglyceryltransferase
MTAYALMFTAGSLAGLLWLLLVDPAHRAKAGSIDPQPGGVMRLDAGLVALGAGLAGARLSFVLSHWGYYDAHPSEIVSIAQGGLSWPGAALAALAGLGLYARVTHQSVWPLADALALPVAVLAAAAWAGCLMEGCAYGRAVAAGPLASPTIDLLGNRLPRFPTQAIGSITALALALGLLTPRWPSLPSGVLGFVSLACLAAVALALDFWRGDPVAWVAGIRLDALGAAFVLCLAGAGLWARARDHLSGDR